MGGGGWGGKQVRPLRRPRGNQKAFWQCSLSSWATKMALPMNASPRKRELLLPPSASSRVGSASLCFPSPCAHPGCVAPLCPFLCFLSSPSPKLTTLCFSVCFLLQCSLPGPTCLSRGAGCSAQPLARRVNSPQALHSASPQQISMDITRKTGAGSTELPWFLVQRLGTTSLP